MRVLIVDPCPDCGDSLASLVRLWGHEVCLAADTPSALAAATGFSPDAVLLEIRLPKRDGWELALLLRQVSEGLFLAAVTTLAREVDQERSRSVGFNAHLVKPVDPEQMQGLLTWWQEVILPGRLAQQ